MSCPACDAWQLVTGNSLRCNALLRLGGGKDLGLLGVQRFAG